MTLESWDTDRGRWVLYKTQAQHSDDCVRYPFEHLPRRIFLDTNVVNLLVKLSDQIFERAPIPDHVDRTRALDTEALMHLFFIGARAGWDILASHKTLEELQQTPDLGTRVELVEYAVQLLRPYDEDEIFAEKFGRTLREARFAAALPDLSDRELVGNAIGLGCDVFCTCDRRTIIKRRQHLHLSPLRILTPVEWWAHVKPWSGLWC